MTPDPTLLSVLVPCHMLAMEVPKEFGRAREKCYLVLIVVVKVQSSAWAGYQP